MRDRAVVALEVVLDADLPVRAERPGDPPPEGEPVQRDAARGEHVGQVADDVGEGRGVGLRMDEDERAELGDGSRQQAQFADREALAARDPAQPAVEVVGPGVVRALERGARAAALEHVVAAMAAHVHECAQDAVLAAHDGERHGAGLRGDVRAGLGDLVGGAGVLPAAAEDQLLLDVERGGVGVPACGERAPLVEAVAHGLQLDIVQRGHAAGR